MCYSIVQPATTSISVAAGTHRSSSLVFDAMVISFHCTSRFKVLNINIVIHTSGDEDINPRRERWRKNHIKKAKGFAYCMFTRVFLFTISASRYLQLRLCEKPHESSIFTCWLSRGGDLTSLAPTRPIRLMMDAPQCYTCIDLRLIISCTLRG